MVNGSWLTVHDWLSQVTMLIDKKLLDEVAERAKSSPRLRMNYNFHQSLDEKCHRFLNAVEPGTVVDIHRHLTKDETFVLLRGRVRVNTYYDDGSIMDSVELSPDDGRYGMNIPKGVWHNLESLETNSVFFECKEVPYSLEDQEVMQIVEKE